MTGGFGGGLNYSMGGSVRSGPRPRRNTAAAGAAAAMASAENAAEDATRAGASFAASRRSGMDPYRAAANKPATVPAEGKDPYAGYDKPDVLPETNMGLKPDLTKANQLRQEYARTLEKQSPFLAGFRGVSDIYRTQNESYETRIKMAEEEAYREAAQRHAEANPWQSLPKDQVGNRGERLERNWMTGEVRPMTYNEAFEEKVEKPVDSIPGYGTVTKRPADAPTWADQYAADPTTPQTAVVTERGVRRSPVRHERAVEIELLEEKAAAADARGDENEAQKHRWEIERIKEQGAVSTATAVASARAHGEESRKNTAALKAAGAYEPRGYDPNTTPTGKQAVLETITDSIINSLGFGTRAGFDAGATDEQRKQFSDALKKAQEELERQAAQEVSPEAGGLGQGALGGRKVGPVASSKPKGEPKRGTVETRKLRGGGTVKVEYIGNGQWKKVG